jgi:hypothetical protein
LTREHGRRFAVAAIGSEGVVLDAMSGEIYRAGAAAVVVFRALGRGADVAGAANSLVQTFAVSPARAERDVRALLASLPGLPRGAGAAAALKPQFRAGVRGGYEMHVDGKSGAWVDEHGRAVERTARNADLLRALAPHVLALAGLRVLHASAVLVRGEVVAFLAPSGTGKTTLARLLEGEGVRVISEDLLVLRDPREAVLEAERALRTWSRSRGLAVSTEKVLASVEGRAKPLCAILVLERRKGQRRFALEALRGADAIMALFANAFVEVPSPRVWRKALVTCRSIAARGIVYRAYMPEGLGALARTLAAAAARRPAARASDAYDPVEALLGVHRPDPRVADAVTP